MPTLRDVVEASPVGSLRDVAGRVSRAELLLVRACLDRARAAGKRLMVLSTDPAWT